MDEIGRKKVEVYKALAPDLAHPGFLTGEKLFTIDKRRFNVVFEADESKVDHKRDVYPMHVLRIDELKTEEAK